MFNLKSCVLRIVLAVFFLAPVALSGCQLKSKALPSVEQWRPLTLSFHGPDTSERADENPFTDYRLWVRFTHKESEKIVRGFYAADGDAAQTSAGEGNVWQVRFSPDKPGSWHYEAFLYTGDNVAITQDLNAGTQIELARASGHFSVTRAAAQAPGFYRAGRLHTQGRYYKTEGNDKYWLKGGTNSPENLLAFKDFDQTYRTNQQNRDGEAASGTQIHHFEPHARDWQAGDPAWKANKGKNLVGLMNYLADMGMNSAYFLTLNLQGDGKEVWPFIEPTIYDRFDVSKLEQWNIVFTHMQSLGIALHIVLQETENERLLDNGDTGPLRQLYLQELIARFGHHPGLIWNLGEENGPAEFSPDAQTDQQRIAMANFIKDADPYKHPVIIHTHSTPESKNEILTPLLGLTALDGLSFQVNHREQVNDEIRKWLNKSFSHKQPWAITMDEIGEWMDGAKTDEVDPTHDSLRRHALWGTILAGGAGVEWYFGAHQDHNDLTAEDLRSRHNLWRQTKIALDFFRQHTRFWEMQPMHQLQRESELYGSAEPGHRYVLYLMQDAPVSLTLPDKQNYTLAWFDPVEGGQLINHPELLTGGTITLPSAPSDKDWVALIEKSE